LVHATQDTLAVTILNLAITVATKMIL
jgi:hypothetical protein